MLNVVEDGDKHLLFCHSKHGVVGVLVRTIVDNTVHVQVKTIEFRDAILCNQLRDCRIPLAHPSEELGDTHGD